MSKDSSEILNKKRNFSQFINSTSEYSDQIDDVHNLSKSTLANVWVYHDYYKISEDSSDDISNKKRNFSQFINSILEFPDSHNLSESKITIVIKRLITIFLEKGKDYTARNMQMKEWLMS